MPKYTVLMTRSRKRKIAKPPVVTAPPAEMRAAREVLSYLKLRAQAEGVPFGLTPNELIAVARRAGLTIFEVTMFGIRVSRETGKIVADDEQPRPGFLDEWNSRALQ